MAINNTTINKWNAFIVIIALLSTAFVSIYSIKKQNDYWEYQNYIKNKEQYNQIKIKKIEDTTKAFTQFILTRYSNFELACRYSYIFMSLSKIPNIEASFVYDSGKDFLNGTAEDIKMQTLLQANLVFHLETLTPLFSDDIVKSAKELVEIINNYTPPPSSRKELFDKLKAAKNYEELDAIFTEYSFANTSKDFYQKFNLLIEAMHLQLKSELSYTPMKMVKKNHANKSKSIQMK